MQTYTHVFVGLAASQLLFPGDYIVQATMVAATIVPDIPAAIRFGLDVLKKKPPLAEQSRGLVMAVGICHSLIVWLISLFSFSVFCGVYSHLVLDAISHGGKEFEKTDPGWAWPLPWRVRGLFEYRTAGAGGLWTPLDLWISGAAIVVFIVLLIS